MRSSQHSWDNHGNTVFQGAERQSLTILINDDDCSIYLAGEWDYLAQYQMYADGDTIQVGQDGMVLERGADPNFYGTVSIENFTSEDVTWKSTVPEPASMLLFGIGTLGFGIIRRRKK